MKDISRSVTRKDHAEKARGAALYVGDFSQDDVLHGSFVRSPHPRAEIKAINYPQFPNGYFAVDYRDVPGENSVHVVQDDSPVFASQTVEYVGEPVALIAGPDVKEVARLVAETQVDYRELPAVLDPSQSETVFFDYHFGRGNCDTAFAQADKIYDEHFSTGYQEQAYLETQGMIAQFAGGKLSVHGSLQCPFYVHGALQKALGLSFEQVSVAQDYTGGGFGGKEAYPSILACQVAVAAHKAATLYGAKGYPEGNPTGNPEGNPTSNPKGNPEGKLEGRAVRVVYDRREDMQFTSKRHPSRTHYRAAVKDGRVTALDVYVQFDSGAFTTLSPVVLQRGIIAAPGVYKIDNLRVHGQAKKTNSMPTGAYRGFGAPQTFFAIELLMSHIATSLGEDPLAFKQKHLVERGNATSTNGIYHYPVPLPEMSEQLQTLCDYNNKRALYAKPQTSRYRRGIGSSLWFHGAGFTGSAEQDFIKAVVRINKSANGQIEVLAANSDIGQGLKTTFCKIVAAQLAEHGVTYEQTRIANPDTSRVPDSGPTVGSRSLMIVGELLRRAAIKLNNEWRDGEAQVAEEHYAAPDFMIPFNLDKFQGDAYPTYAWGAAAVELEIDTLTGEQKILGSWNIFDVGTPIDQNIVTGQMEGGVLQGLGYSSMEQMAYDQRGQIRNNSYSDYIIPTAADVPNLEIRLHVEEYPFGPHGAKGAGELPLVGIAPAYVSAIEQALGQTALHHIPFTQEDVLQTLADASKKEVA